MSLLVSFSFDPNKNTLARLDKLMASVEKLQAKLDQQSVSIDGVLQKISELGELVLTESAQQKAVTEKQSQLIERLKAEIQALQITDLEPLLAELDANSIKLQEASARMVDVGFQLSAIVPDEIIAEVSEPVE